MKRTLKEELERIHELTYGKRLVIEQNVQPNDPKKADLVSDDVNTFYQTLEDVANSGGLTQERRGTMSFKKGVESMQIGLITLGYKLPHYGVDGLFGPETANAVRQFVIDNLPEFKYTGGAPKEMLLKLVTLLRAKGISSNDLAQNIDQPITSGGGDEFTDIDLLSQDGFDMYTQICQKYIDKVNPNAGITGEMLSTGAKMTMENYHKYIPPELVLGQLTLEGGLSKNPKSKPIRTNNPFNVGNVDSGAVRKFPTKQDGINQYFNLIARRYLTKGKSAKDLTLNFVNSNNNRYASSSNYEATLGQIISQINSISRPLMASLNTKPQI